MVHVVRDPRGVAASLEAQQEEWGGRTGQTYCRQVWADMALGEQLGPERYIRSRLVHLHVEDWSEELLHQQSYVIKNQLGYLLQDHSVHGKPTILMTYRTSKEL